MLLGHNSLLFLPIPLKTPLFSPFTGLYRLNSTKTAPATLKQHHPRTALPVGVLPLWFGLPIPLPFPASKYSACFWLFFVAFIEVSFPFFAQKNRRYISIVCSVFSCYTYCSVIPSSVPEYAIFSSTSTPISCMFVYLTF